MLAEELKIQIGKILQDKYGSLSGEVRVAPAPIGVGDLSVNVASLRAVLPQIDPVVAADYLARSWPKQDKFFTVSLPDKGYINFFVNTRALVNYVLSAVQEKENKIGDNDSYRGEKILLEYPSNNTHKDLHVGHLRNICLGGALINIFRSCGAEVIPINYVNDFGAHVAKCLWGVINLADPGAEEKQKNKQRWLGEIYAEASRFLEEHPERKGEVAALQRQLENREKEIIKLYEKTRKASLTGFKKIFDELGVKHHRVFYEQDVKDIGQKIVDKLLESKVARVGDGGAIIVDLEEYGLDIALLRKSDGSGLYLTSDLGLAQVKNKKYPDATESVHLTSIEQDFYFKQLFCVLQLAGFAYKMKHISYGLVTSPTGKMASRLGNVILYEDLRDEVYKKVRQETATRHPDWSAKKINATAKTIAFSAIRFEMLKHEAGKEVVFDTHAVSEINGFTGPYLLYTIARINSLFSKGRKFARREIDATGLKEPEVKNLFLQIDNLDSAILKAREQYSPSVLTKYSFDLAKTFNDFYGKYKFLDAEDPALTVARLALAEAVRTVLAKCLNLLGISTVEEM